MTGSHDAHTDSAVMTRRVDRLVTALEARGLADGDELEALTEGFLSRAQPANGKRLVARAWVDDGFRTRLLADGTEAIEELGYSMRSGFQSHIELRVVANSPDVHNLVVCTLCSCYPVALLGPPPRWYKSFAYRSRAVSEPRAVLRELGVAVADDVEVRVWDSTSELRYMVLPERPAGTEGLDEQQLATLVPRDALVGGALVESALVTLGD